MGEYPDRGRPPLDHMVGEAGGPGRGATPVPVNDARELGQRGWGRQFPLEVGLQPTFPFGFYNRVIIASSSAIMSRV